MADIETGYCAREGYVTPTQLAAAINSVLDHNSTTAIMQSLGDIKASVPLAEGQVQLALAGTTAAVQSHLNAVENSLNAGHSMLGKCISDALASSLASQNAINVTVLTNGSQTREAVALYGNANLVATKDAATANALAVAASTKEILAALNQQNTDNLQRQLSVAESALAEDRARLRSRETEINITNTNTAIAAQSQVQAQQQAQFQILANLAASVHNLAGDIQAVRQTQSNVNFGVQGNAGQTASAANNRVG